MPMRRRAAARISSRPSSHCSNETGGARRAGQWVKATTEYERIMAKGATQAMRKIGKLAVDAGRQAIGAAGFSTKFAAHIAGDQQAEVRALCSTHRFIFIRRSIMPTSSRPARQSSDIRILWLPLPNVPPHSRGGPHMTPRQYIQNVGPLGHHAPARWLADAWRGGARWPVPLGVITRRQIAQGQFSFTGAHAARPIPCRCSSPFHQ